MQVTQNMKEWKQVCYKRNYNFTSYKISYKHVHIAYISSETEFLKLDLMKTSFRKNVQKCLQTGIYRLPSDYL